MEGIGIDWKYLIAQLINFTVLLVILTKLLYGPMKRIIDKRSAEIEDSIKNAEKIKLELESIEKKKTEEFENVKKESEVIIAKARETAKDLESDLAKQAEEKAEHILARAKEDIEAEKEKNMQALKGEIAGIIESSVEKILHEKVDSAEQTKLVEESIEKI